MPAGLFRGGFFGAEQRLEEAAEIAPGLGELPVHQAEAFGGAADVGDGGLGGSRCDGNLRRPQEIEQLVGSDPAHHLRFEKGLERAALDPAGSDWRGRPPPELEEPELGHVLGDLENLMVVAPELLAHPIGEACKLPGQLFGYARPLPQFDDDRGEGIGASVAVAVGAKRIGEHARVATLVLGTAWGDAVAEAIDLLRVDRLDRDTPVHQALHHWRVRDIDGDLGDIATVFGGDPFRSFPPYRKVRSCRFDPSSLSTQT